MAARPQTHITSSKARHATTKVNWLQTRIRENSFGFFDQGYVLAGSWRYGIIFVWVQGVQQHTIIFS